MLALVGWFVVGVLSVVLAVECFPSIVRYFLSLPRGENHLAKGVMCHIIIVWHTFFFLLFFSVDPHTRWLGGAVVAPNARVGFFVPLLASVASFTVCQEVSARKSSVRREENPS
jgi:hypothetical protein